MTKSSVHHSEEFEEERISAGDILEDLRAVVRDAESLLRATEGQVGERVAEVRSRIEEKLEGAREQLHEAGAGKAQHVKTAARSTEKYIRENPWTALLIAAGVGYLIGTAGRRR
jgi:ElaB/YqjD/DUF883 family membrane-anchored ribosome-binding protein